MKRVFKSTVTFEIVATSLFSINYNNTSYAMKEFADELNNQIEGVQQEEESNSSCFGNCLRNLRKIFFCNRNNNQAEQPSVSHTEKNFLINLIQPQNNEDNQINNGTNYIDDISENKKSISKYIDDEKEKVSSMLCEKIHVHNSAENTNNEHIRIFQPSHNNIKSDNILVEVVKNSPQSNEYVYNIFFKEYFIKNLPTHEKVIKEQKKSEKYYTEKPSKNFFSTRDSSLKQIENHSIDFNGENPQYYSAKSKDITKSLENLRQLIIYHMRWLGNYCTSNDYKNDDITPARVLTINDALIKILSEFCEVKEYKSYWLEGAKLANNCIKCQVIIKNGTLEQYKSLSTSQYMGYYEISKALKNAIQ